MGEAGGCCQYHCDPYKYYIIAFLKQDWQIYLPGPGNGL